jgi:hypothetical protein
MYGFVISNLTNGDVYGTVKRCCIKELDIYPRHIYAKRNICYVVVSNATEEDIGKRYFDQLLLYDRPLSTDYLSEKMWAERKMRHSSDSVEKVCIIHHDLVPRAYICKIRLELMKRNIPHYISVCNKMPNPKYLEDNVTIILQTHYVREEKMACVIKNGYKYISYFLTMKKIMLKIDDFFNSASTNSQQQRVTDAPAPTHIVKSQDEPIQVKETSLTLESQKPQVVDRPAAANFDAQPPTQPQPQTVETPVTQCQIPWQMQPLNPMQILFPQFQIQPQSQQWLQWQQWQTMMSMPSIPLTKDQEQWFKAWQLMQNV